MTSKTVKGAAAATVAPKKRTPKTAPTKQVAPKPEKAKVRPSTSPRPAGKKAPNLYPANPEINAGRLERLAKETVAFRERFLYLIDLWAPATQKYQYLEKRTGIPAARWQNLFMEKQMPTLEMILTIPPQWPEHMLWLMTGHVDVPGSLVAALGGQKAPSQKSWEEYQHHRAWLKRKKAKVSDSA